MPHFKITEIFFPSSICLWNSLPQYILRLTNLNAFRKALYHYKLLLRPPSYYSCGPRWLNIMHTRLRLSNSFLNSCLYSRSMGDSPNCVCGDYENIVHFLFYCPRYNNVRWSLFVDLGNILFITWGGTSFAFGPHWNRQYLFNLFVCNY